MTQLDLIVLTACAGVVLTEPTPPKAGLLRVPA
jgi:hypothetical protein